MSQHRKKLPDLTFTGSSTTSNAIALFDDCRNVGLAVIDTTSTGIGFTVQVEPTSTGSDWVDLQSGGSDITVTASEGLVIEPFPFGQLRLLATATSTGTTVKAVGLFVV